MMDLCLLVLLYGMLIEEQSSSSSSSSSSIIARLSIHERTRNAILAFSDGSYIHVSACTAQRFTINLGEQFCCTADVTLKNMSKEHDKDIVTADAILQNLIKRPNVRSTLILSRKDGSIIKATGFVASGTEEPSRPNRGYSTAEAASTATESEGNSQLLQNEKSELKTTEPTLSPAQVLAESIYIFVASAVALAKSLGRIDAPGGASTALVDSARGRHEMDDLGSLDRVSQADDDVQLLRLRLKKQEVIIFPDLKYLCCVVQDLEKGTR